MSAKHKLHWIIAKSHSLVTCSWMFFLITDKWHPSLVHGHGENSHCSLWSFNSCHCMMVEHPLSLNLQCMRNCLASLRKHASGNMCVLSRISLHCASKDEGHCMYPSCWIMFFISFIQDPQTRCPHDVWKASTSMEKQRQHFHFSPKLSTKSGNSEDMVLTRRGRQTVWGFNVW